MSSSARSASSAGFTGTGWSREAEPAWAISAPRSSRTVPNSPAPTLNVSPAASGVLADVSAGAEPARPFGVADVASLLVHRALELGVVQRHDVQRADLVTLGEQPPREVQAEKARTAGDRPRGHSDGR